MPKNFHLSALLLGGLLAGCAQTVAVEPLPTAPAGAYPVSLANCGFDVEIPSSPERVVTIKSSSTELLLALGLEDRIVGSAFADGPVPQQWESAASAIPVLSDEVPSQEALLAAEPDLVLAGWESNLAAGSRSTRPMLQRLGIATYVAPSACKEPEFQPKKMSFDLLFEQFREVGSIFAVSAAVDDLIADEQERLDSVEQVVPGTTALWYSSGDSVPYVGAGIGAPQMVMDELGLTNIAGDVNDTWTSMGWEQIVADDPDVIVLVDATWNSAADKIALLESNPATRTMEAVVHHRFVVVPFPASEAGVRTAAATVQLGEDLGELGYGE